MSVKVDPRVTPARPDLAAAELKEVVSADRYADPVRYTCTVASAAIRRAPGDTAPMDDQLLFGQAMDVYEISNGWAWGQARADNYVGYVRADQISDFAQAPTHRVSALRAIAFSEPDLKSPPLGLYSMNCRIVAQSREGRYVGGAGAGWIFEGHLAPLNGPRPSDHAAVAERFLGAPYLWGGKESLGLDCSGLVQMALTACGHACPRDSDQQEASLGAPVEFDAALSGLQRGDLVFWKGHVGIMLDPDLLIHANAHHMETAVEPLAEAQDRIASRPRGGPITSIRRLQGR